MRKLLFDPDFFPFGRDVIEVKRLPNNIFYKKFRKNSYDSFCKTIFVLEILKENDFIPKIINYNNNNLEMYLTDCGNLGKIRNLPVDWEEQLVNIKKTMIKYNILLKDWGLWEINPFVLNNICVRDDKIYFVDIGNSDYASNGVIEEYFNRKIKSIKLISKYGHWYLPYHYARRVGIMILRKLKRPKNILLFMLGCYCYMM